MSETEIDNVPSYSKSDNAEINEHNIKREAVLFRA